MKTFIVAFVALAVATVHAESCPPTELQKFTPIVVGPDTQACMKDSGVALSPSSIPSIEEAKKMCAAPSCLKVVDAVEAAKPQDCEVLPGMNPQKLLNQLKEVCAGVSSAGSKSAGSKSAGSKSAGSNAAGSKSAGSKSTENPSQTPTQKPGATTAAKESKAETPKPSSNSASSVAQTVAVAVVSACVASLAL